MVGGYIVLIILLLFNKNKRTHSEGRFIFNKIIEENLWVKSYLILYFFILAIGINYIMYNEIELSINSDGLILILISFFWPIIIVREREIYRDAENPLLKSLYFLGENYARTKLL